MRGDSMLIKVLLVAILSEAMLVSCTSPRGMGDEDTVTVTVSGTREQLVQFDNVLGQRLRTQRKAACELTIADRTQPCGNLTASGAPQDQLVYRFVGPTGELFAGVFAQLDFTFLVYSGSSGEGGAGNEKKLDKGGAVAGGSAQIAILAQCPSGCSYWHPACGIGLCRKPSCNPC